MLRFERYQLSEGNNNHLPEPLVNHGPMNALIHINDVGLKNVHISLKVATLK